MSTNELNMREVYVEREIAGRTLRISTGLIAKQAAGAAVVQYGDTVVLTAASSAPPRFADQDFFPLMVDYREKTYAAGKFPGGFFKREKAPSTKEILTMRLTDRPIRPLFPEGFYDEVLVQSIVLSSDLENDADILSIIGASAALSLSPLPFEGPIGAARIGMNDGQLVVNPTFRQTREGQLNLVLAGTRESVTMVEAGAGELTEEKMLEALELGHETARAICEMIDELVEKARTPQTPAKIQVTPPEVVSCLDRVLEIAAQPMAKALCTPGKFGRRDATKAVCDQIVAQLCPEQSAGNPAPEGEPSVGEVKEALSEVKTRVIRDLIKKNTRVDGRDRFTVRPIDCRLGVLPRTHGSSLFTRGETQALVTITLGGSGRDAQEVDGLCEPYDERWYLHYNAPGFSVGEAKMPRGPGRREIGHGMLAQKALQAVMPEEKDFAYVVRAVSEVMEMNGSSSMASVCGATLALLDAGVPIKKSVAGIAMGLIQDPGEEPAIVTDILGDEDHYGDMDFKVCGTQDGITALQMDIKVKGLSTDTMRRALDQAKEGRLHILGKLAECIERPRSSLSPRAPRLHRMEIDAELVGKLIGPGGKNIRGIQDQSGATIEVDDGTGVGVVTICAPDETSLTAAVQMVEAVTATPEIGKVYEGRVTGVREFGCFVEILPGTDGMCHISELSDQRVEKVEDVAGVGDILKVKVVDIDDGGKIRLSRKAVIMEERGEVYEMRRPPSSGGGRGGRPPRR